MLGFHFRHGWHASYRRTMDTAIARRIRPTRPRGPLRAGLLLALLAAPSPAQLSPREPLPELELVSTDGAAFRVVKEAGRVVVWRDGSEERPKALVVHFFQPDCLQCRAQLKPLDALHRAYAERGVVVLGVAHRGTAEQARSLRGDLGLALPLAVPAEGTKIGRAAAGDALGIADASGRLRFAQAGFGEGDEKLWREALEALLAGREPPRATVARERLKAGDRFPSVSLPSLRSGKTMSLTGADGRLLFVDDAGRATKPKAALFFFSRY